MTIAFSFLKDYITRKETAKFDIYSVYPIINCTCSFTLSLIWVGVSATIFRCFIRKFDRSIHSYSTYKIIIHTPTLQAM